MRYKVTDWTWVYDNGANIPKSENWPGVWVEPARQARDQLATAGRAHFDLAYGEAERERFDLFLPNAKPQGLVVFVHGGFWMSLDKSFWSHLSAGPLAYNYAFAVPSYTLAPQVRIADITRAIGKAVSAAAERVEGPIRLIGHSAGGHLVTRMISATTPLSPVVSDRIEKTVSISGIHDLRPMIWTKRNTTLAVDAAEAASESPALLEPLADTRLVCWAGERETSEFLRQNALLANIWLGLGAETEVVVEPDRHHFNIINGLTNPDHPLTHALVG
ncbi:alpha/beta hydrolase [Rhizobium laguerreae]|uniref:alpha/beta hydrolase n=1 Tax=Rhizobium TaxID=379 RepID=UPI001C90C767|nr:MULTISPECIES: alpha/beta hydrolase [Rhizobium]MBY3258657.1 alpha/beta hydrolase [Rhizobium laguerreae]MBY3286494.1 alpha/beta hydrolase [Rhizobium laguerreae]MBY3293157.1 alpha/beta hydrolase [Rhizobium laguerreae]MDU0309908.1 alpha/beta hydrolase [Rhizobium sp. 10PS4]